VSFTVAEIRWLATHPRAVEAAGQLELTSSSQLSDLTRLRQIADDAGASDPAATARALAELVSARRAAVRGAKVPVNADGTPRTPKKPIRARSRIPSSC
jgi:hypothetical protein